MTKEQKFEALRHLTEIERTLSDKAPSATFARACCGELRKLLNGAHGAADHAAKPRARKIAPLTIGRDRDEPS